MGSNSFFIHSSIVIEWKFCQMIEYITKN